jgi:hypothetical protein
MQDVYQLAENRTVLHLQTSQPIYKMVCRPIVKKINWRRLHTHLTICRMFIVLIEGHQAFKSGRLRRRVRSTGTWLIVCKFMSSVSDVHSSSDGLSSKSIVNVLALLRCVPATLNHEHRLNAYGTLTHVSQMSIHVFCRGFGRLLAHLDVLKGRLGKFGRYRVTVDAGRCGKDAGRASAGPLLGQRSPQKVLCSIRLEGRSLLAE